MTYKNPPIKEAVFDIRVAYLNNIDATIFHRIHQDIKNEFPDERTKVRIRGEISYKGDIETGIPVESHLEGYMFSSEDGKKAVQFRLDGFTLNYLEPYSNWEEFHSEAIKHWNLFVKVLKDRVKIRVNRIALRYVNRIMIPLPVDNFKDYIVNMPPIPECLPQAPGNFFMQVQVPLEDQLSVVLTETIENQQESYWPFILDIDISKEVTNNDFNIINDFLKMRTLKNEIFEVSLSPKAKQLFN